MELMLLWLKEGEEEDKERERQREMSKGAGLELRVGTLNVRTMIAKGGELAHMMEQRKVDQLCW